MPKPIARSKTRKAVAKRFKVTLPARSCVRARRDVISCPPRREEKRHLAKMGRVHETDVARIKANLPFA